MTAAIPAPRGRENLADARERVAGDHHPGDDPGETDGLGDCEYRQDGDPAGCKPAEEVADTPGGGAAQRENGRHRSSVVADGACRGLCVELVRVVEDRRLCGSCRWTVVVTCDCVEELGEDGWVEVARALFDHPKPQVDVSEKATFLGLAERRSPPELADASDVVQERRSQDEVVTKPGVKLGRLAAERRDADGVLEEASCVSVVSLRRCGGKRAERLSQLGVAHERVDDRRQPGVRDLSRKELEEPVELVRVASQRRGERRRVGLLRRLDRAHLHLELAAEALDATEDAHGVALPEALVEQVDVVPHPCLHTTARIGELEREVRRSRPCASALLLGHCEHALDGPVLDELGDRGHLPTI